jgi:hypothetical protein
LLWDARASQARRGSKGHRDLAANRGRSDLRGRKGLPVRRDLQEPLAPQVQKANPSLSLLSLRELTVLQAVKRSPPQAVSATSEMEAFLR